MTLTPRQLRKMMISKQGKVWNTKPERQFNEYQESRGLGLVMNVTLPFVAKNRDGQITDFYFQMDFLRPTISGWDVDFEIDGKGHKFKWDEWKDGIKNKAGLKVIHIPSSITIKKYWAYLDGAINWALLSKDGSVYIPG